MRDENAILAYYQKIKDGSETVGKWIRLLYEVIFQGLSDKRWFWDQRLASNAIGFLERYCHHYKGKLAPQRIRLSLWERSSISLIFGIVDGTGKRQFNEVFWEVGRKMGKSLIAGGIGTYMAYAAGEYGSDIYYLAPKLDQADLCYSALEFNVNAEPELRAITKSTKYRGLVIKETNSTVRKLAFTAKKSDGYNPMFYCADEVASWPGASGLRQWEVMVSGTGARIEPLGLAISSGGYENEGLFDELMKRGTAFINGNTKESHLLPILYMIDDPEKWDDLTELKKSLPGLGESVDEAFIRREIDVAYGSISKRTEFITKYCNLKQNSSTAWFEAAVIEGIFPGQNQAMSMRLEDMAESYAVVGVDMSQTTDLTSTCAIIEKNGIMWVFSHFWLPKDRIQEATVRDEIPYDAMVERGYLSLSEGHMVDYRDVYQWIVELIEKYKVYPLKVGYDRWSSQPLVQALQAYGFQTDSVNQGFNLGGICDVLDAMVREKRIRSAEDNGLLKIHFYDAALQSENNLTAHPRHQLAKISKRAHVDGVAAILDALCMRQVHWAELGEQLKNED
ncbi:MAG: terminase large subunit [Oscillospiraceae bacterium]|nr:terminase large subunit [Oscillospiraceae bacterium]